MAISILLTGKQNEGKTTKLLQIYNELQKRKISILGFAAPGIWKNNQKIGYHLFNLNNNQTILLSTVFPTQGYLKMGKFYFNPEALALGNQIMKQALSAPHLFTFIDEIGKFELAGYIWHEGYHNLIRAGKSNVITIVREQLMLQIKEKYNLNECVDYNIQTDDKVIINRLLNL